MNKNGNITLVENNIMLSEIEIAEKLNAFFSNIVKELNIKVKGNVQFVYLCNSNKSSTLGVCTTFRQITQKILTKDIFYCMELITELSTNI